MEKRKFARRKTEELKSAGRGVASDAESTVSTRSSNSNSSSISWKQKQRRLKADQLSSRDSEVPQQETQRKNENDAEGQLKSLKTTLGATLETTEAQVVMILLVALDVGCTALEIHFHDQQQLATALQQLSSNGKDVRPNVTGPLVMQIVTRLVESFTGFTLFLFLIELAILLAAFRRKFFAHAGYMLDLAVVSISLTMELYTQTKAVRLLGVLRVWRVLRLVRRLIDEERNAHETTRLLLEQEQLKLLHVRMQKDAAHESLKREYESREGLEQLLRGYKDEIVTLKEALQIAAEAVAEATMGENIPADTGLYEIPEAAEAGDSLGSYPAAGNEYAYGEEYYQHSAVHPTEMQAEVDAQYWQEHEKGESEYYHQDVAAVHPTELQALGEELWRKPEREDTHQEAAGVYPTEAQSELEAEHYQESERDEFEDAVGE